MSDNADISGLIPEDLAALLGLFGEAASSTGSNSEKKRRVLEELCRLSGAELWAWTLRDPEAPSKKPVYLRSRYGWSESGFERYLLAVNHPGSAAPFPVRTFQNDDGTTRYDHPVVQLNPENGSFHSETAILYGAAGVGKVLLSLRRLDDGRMSAIGLCRKQGAAAFSDRQTLLVKVALNEVEWLHSAEWDRGKPAGPSPFSDSKASVMSLLFSGLSRKEIAARVRLSEHTVNDYVKLIYKHFGVNSQAELVRLRADRDSGSKEISVP